MSKNYPSTPVTMIDRLVMGSGSRDWNRAWESFVEIYSPAIRGSIGYEFNRLGWHHLDERMINTVLSDVIVKFLRASGSFKYDPAKGKFRNYLTQIICWCVRDHITASNHHPSEELTEGNDKADPTDDEPHKNIDRAWKMATFRTFLEEARERLGPQTILIFEMTKILEQPVEEVMEQLRVSRSTVDNANRRVMQLLRELIENSPMKEELK
jgi:RNA polymerase sigma factor (sigma-70 family)